ncbi:hypothetical protein ACFU99_14500 [Streptomyces sp. NPDC057654]|uniref:hypothetical protein n=1 Tax=Streptomyces sp. NPDC057654 TaxID=3346196 RepID=UPI0036CDBA98
MRVDEAYGRRAVVGDRVFAVAIHTDTAVGRVDWRSDRDSHRYEPIDLPEPTNKALVDPVPHPTPVSGTPSS